MARKRRRRNRRGNNNTQRDWRRTAFIIFGILIVASMALSLIAPLFRF